MSRGEIKKLYILYILEILKKYSDPEHKLKQQDIIRYMEKDYGVVCERKTIWRNCNNLCFRIVFDQSIKKGLAIGVKGTSINAVPIVCSVRNDCIIG